MAEIRLDITRFTPQERRILRYLADGQFHTDADISENCQVPLANGNIRKRIAEVRWRLREQNSNVFIETKLVQFVPHYRIIQELVLPKALLRPDLYPSRS